MLTMLYAYSRNLRSQDMQARSQLKIDYAQKEDAMLRALVNVVPNKAIGAMQRGSAANASEYNWEAVFTEAMQLADAEVSIDAATLTKLGKTSAIVANTGDTSYDDVTDLVEALTGGPQLVNAGLSRDTQLASSPLLGQMPAMMRSNNSNYLLASDYPLVTHGVTHNPSYRDGVHLDPNTYRVFNQLDYPNIDFAYAQPGERFVGKQNWWAFSMKFGEKDGDLTGAPAVKKNYVISLYEIPSQLPLSSGASMSVGRHSDGTDWANVTVEGGLFAETLQTQGTINVTDGLISARHTLDLSANTSVDGNSVDSDVYALGTREQALAASNSDVLNASIGGNVGKSAFIPMSRGNEFFDLQGDNASSLRISPTGWNSYTTGGVQCDMRLRILEVAGANDQTPIEIQFYYRQTNNSRTSTTFTRGSNWPHETDPGGDLFPFQTEMLALGRHALIYHPERMPAFLAALNAGDVETNASIYIYPDSSQPNVNAPAVPSTSDDLAVVLRSCEDLTDYTTGFSLVTNCRLYIGESLNLVTLDTPDDAGLDAADDFYPPVSLFAPEKRYGTATVNQPIKFHGQLSSLKTDQTSYRPLDMKSGSGENVRPDRIDAELKRITSPAELPPITLMNWLVTIREIRE